MFRGNRIVAETDQARVTAILRKAESDSTAAEELLPLVYGELRRRAAELMVAEAPGNTLQPTALVHEAYLRLVGDPNLSWESRGHFFGSAARSMRQILINRALRKKAEKHGGGRKRKEIDEAHLAAGVTSGRILEMDEALKRLAEIDERKERIVMLRYFAGLTIDETAKALDISPSTVTREWRFAITWLKREMDS